MGGQEQPILNSTFSALRKSNLQHPDVFEIHCLDLPIGALESIAASGGVNGTMLDKCESIWKNMDCNFDSAPTGIQLTANAVQGGGGVDP